MDVDCFGAQGALTGAALGAVRHGGLLYLTCTDGLGASGRAPHQSLVQYGCFTQPTALPTSRCRLRPSSRAVPARLDKVDKDPPDDPCHNTGKLFILIDCRSVYQ